MVIIGIDPGQTGAIAILNNDRAEVIDTPVCKIKKSNGKGYKTEYLPEAMADILSVFAGDLFDKKGIHVYMESVHSMPRQGVASTFKFGKGYGMWLGIIAALKLPYTLVIPQRWKKEMMQGMPKEKEMALIRASQIFPKLSHLLKRKIADTGRADALLIAEYGLKITK